MRTPHHLLQLVPNRIAAAAERLRETIWTREIPLLVEASEATERHVPWDEAIERPLRPVVPGETWGRLFDQRWCRLDLPSSSDGRRYLEWRDQGEGTLYVDGIPYYGFDVAHRFAPLPETAKELWVESLCVQSAIWHPDATGLDPEGSRFAGAFIARRDDERWHGFHDLNCLLDLMLVERPGGSSLAPIGLQPPVDRASPVYRRLLRVLDEAVDALDMSGVPAMRERLAAAYREFRDDNPLINATLTGHAHIDLVWLWPERIGDAKTVHSFATADRLMDAYPEFRFTHSQPASYQAVARRAPELFDRVKARMAAGVWEATGVLQVESDTLLPCGEALARSFTIGQGAFEELRGSPARLVWLPDVFGYAMCLPQIMKLSGVDYFFTSKVTWSGVTRFPLSSFIWRGLDGSEVLAHVVHEVGYIGTVKPSELKLAASAHVQNDVHPEFLFPTGYGDGGGGPTEEMCERVRRFAAVRGLPAVNWDLPEAFFDRLATRHDQLPVYTGELYLEYHRGTYTTQARVKAAYRALERALQLREAVAVCNGTAPDLLAEWQRLIFAQFHDFLPGSSVPEVYAEGILELEALAADQQKAASEELSGADGVPCLFNPLPIKRTVIADGAVVELPPLSGVMLSTANKIKVAPLVADTRQLSNGLVSLQLDSSGGVLALAVEGHDLPVLPGCGNLILYPDRAANFESWDIDRQTLALGSAATGPATIIAKLGDDGLRGEVAVRRCVGTSSDATIRYSLEAGSAILRVTIELDWHEPETLIKYHVVSGYRGTEVRCGTPFGSILRPQQPGPLAAEAMWEIPASRWIAGTDDGGRSGMFIATAAKYGFSCENGDWGVSLVRSPRQTGFEAHRVAYPAGLSRIPPTSIYTDQGRHVIALAIGRYDAAGDRERHPAAIADTCFTPPLSYVGQPRSSGLIAIDGGDTLIPSWAKPLGPDDWVLRLHEVAGERGVARLVLAPGWVAQLVDLRENSIGPLAGESVSYTPYQIVSLRLTRA